MLDDCSMWMHTVGLGVLGGAMIDHGILPYRWKPGEINDESACCYFVFYVNLMQYTIGVQINWFFCASASFEQSDRIINYDLSCSILFWYDSKRCCCTNYNCIEMEWS